MGINNNEARITTQFVSYSDLRILLFVMERITGVRFQKE
jgi:hypothetical protein